MKTFIQLRDNIGFAVVHTADGEPDHSVTPDHTTAIEVTGIHNPEQFIKMKYDEKTDSWSEPPLIVFGYVDEFGNIIEIRRTVFQHEAEGHVLIPSDYKSDWQWVNNEWVKPTPVDHSRYQIAPGIYEDDLIIQAPEETEEERLARIEGINNGN